jgi:hypothetical protein
VQTQTRGERYVPPTRHTAVGAADFAERTVLIALKSSIEAEYFMRLYLDMGWRVVTANRKSKFLDLARSPFVGLVITDRFRYLVAVRSFRRDGRMPPLHFVANDAKHAKVLLDAGVEAVMVRTIRHDDFFSYDYVQRVD